MAAIVNMTPSVTVMVTVTVITRGARLMLRALIFPIKIYGWFSTKWAKIRHATPSHVVIRIEIVQEK